jgi:hypothetical protein
MAPEDKNTPLRVFYHMAPAPDWTGRMVEPPAVIIATDTRSLPLAWRWIRRRLGLRAYGPLVEGCAFTDEILPLPDPEAPGALMTSGSSRPRLTADNPVVATSSQEDASASVGDTPRSTPTLAAAMPTAQSQVADESASSEEAGPQVPEPEPSDEDIFTDNEISPDGGFDDAPEL